MLLLVDPFSEVTSEGSLISMSCQPTLLVNWVSTGIPHDLCVGEFVEGLLSQLRPFLYGHVQERFMHRIIRFLLGLDIFGRVFARYVRPIIPHLLFKRKESVDEGWVFVKGRLQLGKDLFLLEHRWVNRLVGNIVGGIWQLASDLIG